MNQEMEGCQFKDVRLAKRFGQLLDQMSQRMGVSMPFACQDWAATKAAYRFFSNDRVDEHQILAGHFEATKERIQSLEQRVLILHDTTEFSYQRNKDAALNPLRRRPAGVTQDGKIRHHTARGILMHSSLEVTIEGLPLGLTSVKFWTRKKFKGCDALKRRINPTRVSIKKKESIRWLENMQQSENLLACPHRCIHIGDREADIYELFCTAQEIKTSFLIRTCADRLANGEKHTVADHMKSAPVRGEHRIEVRDTTGQSSQAVLEIKFEQVHLLPPVGKRKQYPSLMLHVIHAREHAKPRGRQRID